MTYLAWYYVSFQFNCTKPRLGITAHASKWKIGSACELGQAPRYGQYTYPKAVAHGTYFLAIQIRSHFFQHQVNNRVDSSRQVTRGTSEPSHEVEVGRPVQLDRVPMEEVRHNHKVAVCSKLVRNELSIYEPMPDYICKNENSVFRRSVSGIREIGIHCDM